jgi:hypothetical protein
MAKKIESFDTSFDLDDDLDMGSFDLPDFDLKDDRKPTIKVISGLKKGIVDGVRDKSFLKQVVKDTLPRGYGQSMDLTDTVVGNIRDITQEATNEMRPAIKEVKKSAAKLIPADSKLVPKKLGDLLKRWKKENEEEEKGSSSGSMQRDTEMTKQLTEMFGAMASLDVEREAKKEGESRLQEGIDLSRHKDVVSASNDQNRSLRSLDQFNRLINLPVQKKTLELLHRQLFMQQDTLAYMREADAKRNEWLANIMKNTGLPDFVKIAAKENLHQIVRNKFFDSANQGLFGDRNQAIEKITTGLRDKVVGTAKQAAYNLSQASSAAEQAKDAAAQGEEFGMDKWNTAGQMAGNIAGQGILGNLAFRAKDKIKGSWIDKKLNIIGRGNRLEAGMNAIPEKINDFRVSGDYDFDDSLKGRAMRLLQTLTPDMQADMVVNRPSVRSMDNPMSFTQKTNKSITEIIPGFLSRILREIQVLRTGGQVELTEFDLIKGKFTSKSDRELNAFRSIFNPDAVSATQSRLKDITGLIDENDELSPEAKEALQGRLLNNSAKLRGANKRNLGNASAYVDAGASPEVAKEVSAYMEKFFSTLDDEKGLIFSRLNKELTTDIGESRGAIQQQVNLGNTEQLEKLGLLKPGGKSIQLDAIIKQYLDTKNARAPGVMPGSDDPDGMGPDHDASAKALQSLSSGIKDKVNAGYKSVTTKLQGYKDMGLKGSMQDISSKAQATAQTGIDTVNANVQKVKSLDWKATSRKIQAKGLDALNLVELSAWSVTKHPFAQQAKQEIVTRWKNTKDKTNAVWVNIQKQPWFTDALRKVDNFTEDKNKPVVQTLDSATPTIANATASATENKTNDFPFTYSSVKPKTVKLPDSKALSPESFKATDAPASSKDEDENFDVYVEGETQPRLRDTLIKAGEYADRETGEIIKSVQDIKNDVVDKLGRVVLSMNETDRLRKYSKLAKRFIPFKIAFFLAKPGLWVAKKLWAFQTKIAPKLVAFNYNLVKKTGKFIASKLFSKAKTPKDIYVQGEVAPRIFGVKLQAGYYRDRDSNQVIFDASDIKGAVIDQEGNTVINDDELDSLQTYNSVFKVFNPFKLFGITTRAIGRGLKHLQLKVLPKISAFNAKLVVGSGKLLGKLLIT